MICFCLILNDGLSYNGKRTLPHKVELVLFYSGIITSGALCIGVVYLYFLTFK